MNDITHEAKEGLGTLLAEVARGNEVTITEAGVPVAKLVPIPPTFDRERAKRAADGILALGQTLSLGGLRIVDLIAEGRR